jgi:enoyl-CoA hydratase/carnithine racemase
MSEPAVLYERRGPVVEIALNRPDQRNSMTDEVLEGLREAVARARCEPQARCLIITGSGSSFCAGADLRGRLQRGPTDGEPWQPPHERSYAMYSPFLSVLDVEYPTIAAMQGHAVGGGLGLALVCDLRVANRDARYGANFTRLGLHPGMATTYILPRLVGLPRAAELLFTGRLISGAEAAELGLANSAVAADEVLSRARTLADEIAAAAPLAVRWTKRSLYRHVDWEVRRAAELEAHAQSRTLETEDAREGVRAQLEKRAPVFRGR